MSAADQLRCSCLLRKFSVNHSQIPRTPAAITLFSSPNSRNHKALRSKSSKLQSFAAGGGNTGGNSSGNGRGGSGGGWSGGSDSHNSPSSPSSSDGFAFFGLLLNGWRSRVAADSKFPFKVLMEQLVGVSASVIGDMASRPNFGLNELDFVFSTLVVGSILNFTLMYLLAPTLSSSNPSLPAIFANCPPSHMFEPGAYTVVQRLGTFVYKGTIFAAVGLGAGLVGTAFSNGLIKLRKKMDPSFDSPNKPPPTLLNSLTWALQMGVSSNLRYQTLNGIEFLMDKVLPALVFNSSVLVLRCLNNVLGGMSFVMLARLTGSQSAAAQPKMVAAEAGLGAERKKLMEGGGDSQRVLDQGQELKKSN